MPAVYNKNLEFMIDIEDNLEVLAQRFRREMGTMRTLMGNMQAISEELGTSFSDVMATQIAASLVNIAVLLADLIDKMENITGRATTGARAIGMEAEDAGQKTQKAIEETAEKYNDHMDEMQEKTDKFQDIWDKDNADSILAKMQETNEEMQETAPVGVFGRVGNAIERLSGRFNRLTGTATAGFEEQSSALSALQTSVLNANARMTTFTGESEKGIKGLIQRGLSKAPPMIQGIARTSGVATRALVGMGRTAARALTKSFALIAKAAGKMWNVMMGGIGMFLKPLMRMLGQVAKWLGILSFAQAITGLIELDATVNDIARTIAGAGEDAIDFQKATNRLMTDIKNSAFEAGANIQEMAQIYRGLAEMHLPVEELKSLADVSFMAAKGLGLSQDQATQMVGTLAHVGRLSDREIKQIVGQFALLQQNVGLSASETQALARSITETTRRIKSMGATTATIQSYTEATTSLAATFVKVGLDAEEAAKKVQDLFDPEQIEQNIALYSQLGITVEDAMGIMQGVGEVPADTAQKFVELSRKIVAMGPIAGKAYAKTMNMSYGMAQQLASITGDAVSEVNKLLGRTTDEQEKAAEEQLRRQREQQKEQLEMAKNRMQLMMMETLQPIMEFIKRITKALNKLFMELRPLLKPVQELMMQIVDEFTLIIPPITDLISKLMRVFFSDLGQSSIFSQILNIVKIVVQVVTTIIDKLGGPLTQFMGTFIKVIGQILEGIGNFLVAIMPGLQALFVFLADIMNIVGNIIAQLLKDLQPAFVVIGKVLGTMFQVFGRILTNLFQKLAKPLSKLFQVISKIIESLLGPMEKILMALMPIFDMFTNLLAQIVGIIAELLDELMPLIEMLANTFADIFANLLGPLVQQIFKVVAELLTALMPSLKVVIGAIAEILEALMPFIEMVLMPLIRYVLLPTVRLAAKIVEWSVKLIAKIIEKVAEAITWVIEKMSNFLNKLKIFDRERRQRPEQLEEGGFRGFLRDLFAWEEGEMGAPEGMPGMEEAEQAMVERQTYGIGADLYTTEATEAAATAETFKGMTDKQADDLLVEQKEVVRTNKSLNTNIEALNTNIQVLVDKQDESARTLRQMLTLQQERLA